MTTFDVICFNQELMDRMNKLGIKLNDTQYIELYKEYSRMLENNEKTTYIVVHCPKDIMCLNVMCTR